MTSKLGDQLLLDPAWGRPELRDSGQEQGIDKASKKASRRSGQSSGCTSNKGQLTYTLYTFLLLCQGKNARRCFQAACVKRRAEEILADALDFGMKPVMVRNGRHLWKSQLLKVLDKKLECRCTYFEGLQRVAHSGKGLPLYTGGATSRFHRLRSTPSAMGTAPTRMKVISPAMRTHSSLW